MAMSPRPSMWKVKEPFRTPAGNMSLIGSCRVRAMLDQGKVWKEGDEGWNDDGRE
jgi:hypothetical protein